MRLAIITSHAGADSLGEALLSWGGKLPVFIQNGKDGMLPAYQAGYDLLSDKFSWNGHRWEAYDFDVLAYFHDDLIIRERAYDWIERVGEAFEDPQVGLVGFGGGLGHGSPELYKVPYDYHQLGRSNFLSNMDDAEAHGKRFTESCNVAVLDGFALIVRREVLEKAGGWPLSTLDYIGYDYWLSCMTRRLGYRIRLCGISCNHLGGRTYVKLGLGDKPDHWEKYLAAHEYIYREFKDCLPFSVV